MTLSSTTKSSRHTGTGSDDALATGFAFFADSEVEVYKITRSTGVRELLTQDTEYTLSGGGASGSSPASSGTVTVVNGATNFPSTVDWEIRRVVDYDNARDYSEGDDFPAISIEGALDYSAMQALQLEKWVLLDEATATAGSDIELRSADWPTNYDCVRIELFNVFPASAQRIRFRLWDGSAEDNTSVKSTLSTIYGITPTQLNETINSWGTSSTATIDPNTGSGVNGHLTVHHLNGTLTCFGQLTYLDSTDAESAIAHIAGRASGSYASIDGWNIDCAGSVNLTGLARLWGMPKA